MEKDHGHLGLRGDGVADDSAALQELIDATRGRLELPPGTYGIRRGLVVDLARRGKTEIHGPGARIINRSPEPAILVRGTHQGTADPKQVGPAVWSRESTPLLRGIEIEGADPDGDGIALESTWQPVLTEVSVHGCRHGIRLSRSNRNVIIGGCHVYHNRGVGIFLDHVNLHQIIVNGNHVSYNAGGGIKVVEGSVRNIQIVGNDIEYNFGPPGAPSGDVWFVAGADAIREVTIAGNTIQALPQADGANVRIEGIGPECRYKTGLVSITGNHISGEGRNILLRHARAVSIQGNTMLLGPERNILAVSCDQIAIGPNVIDDIPEYGERTVGGVELVDCTGSAITGLVLQNARHGIRIVGSSGINVVGCVVKEPEACGIELVGSFDSRVSDCIVGDAGGRNGATAAIREAADCGRNMIVGNRVTGAPIESRGKGTLCEGNLEIRGDPAAAAP